MQYTKSKALKPEEPEKEFKLKRFTSVEPRTNTNRKCSPSKASGKE